MGKFINPFTDFGFHRIFGQEVHKELLIDFLNQLFFGENRTSARMILMFHGEKPLNYGLSVILETYLVL